MQSESAILQHAHNCYESSTSPLHYADNTLVQRNDVVLHLIEQDGRIVKAEIARVWDTIYYQDGSPIGVVLVNAETPKNTMPILQIFTIQDVTGTEMKYFRGSTTIPQEQIFTHISPLFRYSNYLKHWNPETKQVHTRFALYDYIYPEPDQIYEDFFYETVFDRTEQGDAACLFTAGLWKRTNYYPHDALRFFQAAAERNFAAAWLELGLAYEGSDLLTKNESKAAACFQQAVDCGSGLAAYRLAICYIIGTGVQQSDSLAISYLKLAIDRQIFAAYLDLALFLFKGTFNHLRLKNSPYRTLPQKSVKPREALQLFQHIAKQNWKDAPVAKFYLGEMYRTGKGTRPDLTFAFKYYREAVEEGDMTREEIQSACYYIGKIDRLEGIVENNNDPYAAYLLGRMLWSGENAERNRTKGKRFLKIASQSGHECAEEAAKLLQQKEEDTPVRRTEI